jgi:hypothetical protein
VPSSGARSGTKPNRPGASGNGRVGPIRLTCGHETHAAAPVVTAPRVVDSLWQCPNGCGLVKRRYGAAVRIDELPPHRELLPCPNCGGPRDEATLRFCAKCRRIAL